MHSRSPSTYDVNDDHENGLGDAGDLPLLRAPSQRSAVSLDPSFPGGFAEPTDEEQDTNIWYGRIPQRVPRRYKIIKRVELFHGNFVLDSAVPTKLLNMCGQRDECEFTHMRYTAATCDPNDFKDSWFTLRQVHYDPPWRTELFIVMTMYNEDEELFTRMMYGVMKNIAHIAHLCKRDRSKTWGKDGWKKVVVCIVSDGRQKINSRTLSVVAAMGAYQDGIAKNIVNGKPVAAYIYEYTTQISVTPSNKIAEKGIVPVQIIFCLKEKNQKKINSHRWFFNAFGPILQPNVCGTSPGPTSIYHLWKAFDINSNVGGACGEIVALKGRWGEIVFLLIRPIPTSGFQSLLKTSSTKCPTSSTSHLFGYITVLPGAFSAYRYIALQNDAMGEGPLQKYFLGETMHGAGADIFTANMYLAEDRILCWELVPKRGGSWVLHYVKSAYGVTDTPDQVPDYITSTTRLTPSCVNSGFASSSSTSFQRDILVGNFFIAFFILSNALEDPEIIGGNGIKVLNTILQYAYVGLLLMCFMLSLGNRPQGSNGDWSDVVQFSAFFLAVKGIHAVAKQGGRSIQFGDLVKSLIFRDIVISLGSTLGLYIVSSLIHFDPWHMGISFLQYLLLAPSYINVLNVYAFANVHDVSWGTKGDNKVNTDLGVVKAGKNADKVEVAPPKKEHMLDVATQQEDYDRNFRTNVSYYRYVMSRDAYIDLVFHFRS
ncbi:hypothetical protein EW146_g2370 [Bondarzewia mesenterica]|uniref:Chitin synthase n=1 Tax=Bondarzewia mesenterica TaxID=1095465 RepID=A0A4S4M2B8_9AGAM|nr:hypothetical protein EW146_g2370 [Bondarzewia mesenterica]